MGSAHNDKAFLDYYKVHMAEFCEMLRGTSHLSEWKNNCNCGKSWSRDRLKISEAHSGTVKLVPILMEL